MAVAPPDDDRALLHAVEEVSAAPWEVVERGVQTVPVVFASPHSGRDYPAEFLAVSRLDSLTVRRSEDAFVDEIFAAVPDAGAPLLRAHFPRAFVDPNREAYELDPAMFEDALPSYVNTNSPRVEAGLGTIARVVTSGEEIYGAKLRFADAKRRIETYYVSYHKALRGLVDATRERFGVCLLVDCHSMPSVGGPMDNDRGRRRVDFVLGDCHGTACAPLVTDMARQALSEMGYVVTQNAPYAGGFTTRHYGRPYDGVHALQIEINRNLYMDEERITRGPGLEELAARMGRLVKILVAVDGAALALS
jgi:N-formylglutamate amidohydrolase